MKNINGKFADDFEGSELVRHRLRHVTTGKIFGPVTSYMQEYGARIDGRLPINSSDLYFYTVEEGEKNDKTKSM